jgi:hypothetical protein
MEVLLASRHALDSVHLSRLVSSLEDGLRRERPKALEREGQTIRFTAGTFRTEPSWNLVAFVSKGSVEVLPHERGALIRYQLDFIGFLIATAVLVVALFTPFALRGAHSVVKGLGTLALMWVWIYGGTVSVAIWRFSRFARRLRSAIDRTEGAQNALARRVGMPGSSTVGTHARAAIPS